MHSPDISDITLFAAVTTVSRLQSSPIAFLSRFLKMPKIFSMGLMAQLYGALKIVDHKGTISAETFITAMKTYYGCCIKRKRVFVMDNAPVHDRNEIIQLAADNGDSVVFNAPYYPETNPIENVFGIWKARVNAVNERCELSY